MYAFVACYHRERSQKHLQEMPTICFCTLLKNAYRFGMQAAYDWCLVAAMCVCITNDIDSVNLEESDEQIVEEQEEMYIEVYRAWRRAVNDSRDRNAKRVDWSLLIEAFRRSAYEGQRRGLTYVKSNYSDLIIKTSM